MIDMQLKSWAFRVKLVSCISRVLRKVFFAPLLVLKGGETVLDPSMGGKDEESERNLRLAGTAMDKREE